jgi:hypothetical protein
MRIVSRLVLLGSLSLWACGGGGTAKKPIGGGDAAEATADGGPIGRRGGGNGSFGGVDDDAGSRAADAGDGPAGSDLDGASPPPPPPPPPADAAAIDARPDARPRDALTPGPDVVVPMDSTPPRDLAVPPDSSSGSACDNGTCAGLSQQYQDALARATSCITTLKGQCAQKAPRSLECPCSQAWVNSTVETDMAAANYRAAGCDKCKHLCPAICPALSTGVCSPSKLALVQDPTTNIVAPPLDHGTCTDSGSGGAMP